MQISKPPVRDLNLAEFWPENAPLIAFVGGGRHHVYATAVSEVSHDEVRERRFVRGGGGAAEAPPFGTGIVGVVAYAADAKTPHRAFRVHRSLVHDRARGVLWRGDDGQTAENALSTDEEAGNLVAAMTDAEMTMPRSRSSDAAFELMARETDEEYLRRVGVALEDIRAGRYYQINLLRRFLLRERPTRRALLARLATHGGPYAVAFDVPDLSLISFSPERFVAIAPTPDAILAETWPVKGTAPRERDPAADAASAKALRESEKDRAELAMIVDLMRNDLGRVAEKGSVAVPEPLVLSSHANVHHLSARVTARLRDGVAFGAVLDALCPGGSITGAPKREVMRAIAELEGAPRGYFMGNAYYLDDGGAFDSSILIRTVVAQNGGSYEFAAGSGLVIKSDPRSEMAEIAAKARVVGPIV